MEYLLSKNSKVFSGEVSGYYERQYADFMTYQEMAVNTLIEVDRICRKNGIVYYMAFGSLLGAIRDQGQIPWDYDIDILVPYKYKDELLNALDKDMSSDYHYVTRFKDRNCRHYTVKVAPKGIECEILHVDIFWMLGEDSDPKIQQRDYRLRNFFYKAMIYKHPHKVNLDGLTKIGKIKRVIKNFKYYAVPEKLLERKYLKLFNKSIDEYEMCTYNGRNLNLFRTEWFGNPQDFTTVDGSTFYIPGDYDSILRSTYGDYMKIPSLEKRIDEFQRSLKRLNGYARSDKK